MKKFLIIFFLFPIVAFSQTPQMSYVVPTLTAMKLYYGAANKIYVVEKNADYVQCVGCTVDSINVFLGTGGRKWMKVVNKSVDTFAITNNLLLNGRNVNGISNDSTFTNADSSKLPTSWAVKSKLASDSLALQNSISAKRDKSDTTNPITGSTTLYQNSLKVSKIIADATYATITNLATKTDGSGTVNYFPKFSASKTFGNSTIMDSSGFIGINANPNPLSRFTINPVRIVTANKNKGWNYIIGVGSNPFTVFVQDSVWNGSAYIPTINSGYGTGALANNKGLFSTGFGPFSLQNNTGNYSYGGGYSALQNNTGDYATGQGYTALQYNTGIGVTGIGYFALHDNTGDYATGQGYSVMPANTGKQAIGMGNFASYWNTGDSTISIGPYSMFYNNSSNRIAIGYTKGTDINFVTDTEISQSFSSANISGTTINIPSHGFGATGRKINLRYNLLTGTGIGGLADLQTYQFTIVDSNHVSLSKITSAGSGTFSLSIKPDKSNSIFIGNNINNTKPNQTLIGSKGNTEVKLNGALAVDSFQFKRLVIIGDSYSTSDKWPSYIYDSFPAIGKYNKVDFAIPGQQTASMIANYPTTAHLSKPVNKGDDFWLFTYGGINDLSASALTGDSVYANLKWLWANARADGYKVVAFTVINSMDLTAPKEAERVKLNKLILSDPSLYDYVIDVANVFDRRIDATVFADSTHLNATGWKMFAGTIARTINKVPYTLSTLEPISATYPNSHTPTRFYATFSNPTISKGYTVATLPTGIAGMTAYVTDATSPTYLTTVAGGGTTVVPVFFNGTNWVCH